MIMRTTGHWAMTAHSSNALIKSLRTPQIAASQYLREKTLSWSLKYDHIYFSPPESRISLPSNFEKFKIEQCFTHKRNFLLDGVTQHIRRKIK